MSVINNPLCGRTLHVVDVQMRRVVRWRDWPLYLLCKLFGSNGYPRFWRVRYVLETQPDKRLQFRLALDSAASDVHHSFDTGANQ